MKIVCRLKKIQKKELYLFTNFVNNNNNTRFLVCRWGLYLTNHGLINNSHFQ